MTLCAYFGSPAISKNIFDFNMLKIDRDSITPTAQTGTDLALPGAGMFQKIPNSLEIKGTLCIQRNGLYSC
jgi:hypothetical protein